VGGGVVDPHRGHVGFDALGQATEDVVGQGRGLALGVGVRVWLRPLVVVRGRDRRLGLCLLKQRADPIVQISAR
jgi:hypothetical protein